MKLNYQYAHHAHDESEDKTIQSVQEVLTAFDAFDWVNEVNKAKDLQKCSPTLTFILKDLEEYIWVSAYENNGRISFVSECHFPGEVSTWFGRFKKQGTVNLDSNEFSMARARHVLELFVRKEYNKLRKIYV